MCKGGLMTDDIKIGKFDAKELLFEAGGIVLGEVVIKPMVPAGMTGNILQVGAGIVGASMGGGGAVKDVSKGVALGGIKDLITGVTGYGATASTTSTTDNTLF